MVIMRKYGTIMLNDNFLFHCRNLSQYLKKLSIRKVSIRRRHTPNTKKNQISVVESLISLVFDASCTYFFINDNQLENSLEESFFKHDSYVYKNSLFKVRKRSFI